MPGAVLKRTAPLFVDGFIIFTSMKTQFTIHTLLKRSFFLLVTAVLASACGKSKPAEPAAEQMNAEDNKLKQASWVLGEWRNHTPKGVLSEVWWVKDDSTYAGRSSFVVGKDTVSSETVELGVRGGKLLYIPKVKNQNDGQPVTFTEKTVTATEMVFENPEHDFPQRITYAHPVEDSLVAVISGMKGDVEKSLKFPMQRVK
jgi:hypothetical protein